MMLTASKCFYNNTNRSLNFGKVKNKNKITSEDAVAAGEISTATVIGGASIIKRFRTTTNAAKQGNNLIKNVSGKFSKNLDLITGMFKSKFLKKLMTPVIGVGSILVVAVETINSAMVIKNTAENLND